MSSATERLAAALTGRYQVERELGQGGMAMVYLAEDVRHHRKVALKLLRPELAAVIGAERFLQEIRTTANLQHPHILGLIDSGESDGLLWYVMPFVQGESLRDRLHKEKQLGVEEAVEITRAVASALDYAHRHGVIHRDIKPENILLHDGQALVADFGISLAVSSAGANRMTETGLSLGTPQYMSPEQAMGDRQLDARSDIYSLGATLYEMLAGDPPYFGSTAQAIVAKVITESPTLITVHRDTVPTHVAAAVHKALAKLPADRFHSAAEFADALAGKGPPIALPSTPAATPVQVRRRAVAGIAVGAIAAMAFAAGWWFSRVSQPAQASTPVRFTIPATGPEHLAENFRISPDGRTLVLKRRNSTGQWQLYARRLETLEERPIPGTEAGTVRSFSPDGRSLLFSEAGRFYRVPLGGGPKAEVLRDAQSAAWGENDVLVYNRFVSDGIWRRPLTGGEPEQLTTPDTAGGELGHWSPRVLPRGKGVLFTAFSTPTKSRIEVYDIAHRRRIPVAGDRALDGRYADGNVVFWKRGVLFAVPFDAERLEVRGTPIPVLEDVAGSSSEGDGYFDVSGSGTLVYLRDSEWRRDARVVWVDRSGREFPTSVVPGPYLNVKISPDGRTLALVVLRATRNIWLYDLSRSTLTPLTNTEAAAFEPVWSPDGSQIYYTNETPAWDIYRIQSDGSSPPAPVVVNPSDKHPMDVSPDGRTLLFRQSDQRIRLMLQDLTGEGQPRPLTDSREPELLGRFSPDGRWIAYSAEVTEGRPREVFLRPVSGSSRRQLSVSGGDFPLWARDGRGVMYVAGDSIMTVSIDPAPGSAQPARLLFRSRTVAEARSWDLSPDGQRFLMVVPVERPAVAPLTVVLDWTTELRAKMAK